MTDTSTQFLVPQCRHQKHYEVLRAAFVDKLPLQEIALRFGFSYGTVRNLCSAFRKNPDITPLFIPDSNPSSTKSDPQNNSSQEFREKRDQRILELRKQQGLSVTEIVSIRKPRSLNRNQFSAYG